MSTLPVRVELERQLRRRRTQVAFGFLVALPGILAIAFAIGGAEADSANGGLIELATRGGINFTVFTLLMAVGFLLVVVTALFFGDSIASEASWSSLRYLLAIPIPRSRVVLQKAIVSVLLSVSAIVVLVASALVIGTLAYGTDALVDPYGDSMSYGSALLRLMLAMAFVAVNLIWVAGLALLLSVCTDAPLGAVGGTVMVAILAEILDQITALGTLRDWLPGHFSTAWLRMFAPTIDWHDVVIGAFSALAYGVTFALLAWWQFARKDITS